MIISVGAPSLNQGILLQTASKGGGIYEASLRLTFSPFTTSEASLLFQKNSFRVLLMATRSDHCAKPF